MAERDVILRHQGKIPVMARCAKCQRKFIGAVKWFAELCCWRSVNGANRRECSCHRNHRNAMTARLPCVREGRMSGLGAISASI